MAFLRMAFFPDGTDQHWAAVVHAIGDVAPPSARLMLAAGPLDGGWQVVQLWNSREELDRFNRAVYFPAISRLGDGGFPHLPVVTDVETVEVWLGRTD